MSYQSIVNKEQTTSKLGNFASLSVGSGNSILKATQGYLYSGSSNPGSAPFKVVLATGALSATGATISGNITATGGSITGDMTVTGRLTVGTGSGKSLRIDGTTGDIVFRYNGIDYGSIGADTSHNTIYVTDTAHLFRDGSSELAQINQSGISLPTNRSITWTGGRSITGTGSTIEVDGDLDVSGNIFANDHIEFATSGSGGYIRWGSGRSISDKGSYLQIEGDEQVNGSLYPDGNKTRDCGTGTRYWRNIRAQYGVFSDLVECQGSQGKSYSSYGFVTAVRLNGGSTQAKYREITTKGGIVTNISSESGWL